MRILLIGNSFTWGIKPYLVNIIKSAKLPVTVNTQTVAGWGLAQHASNPTTLKKIKTGNWDYVVLQENSAGIGKSNYPYAGHLNNTITTAGAKTAFLMTWRDRDDNLSTYNTLKGVIGGDYGYVPIGFKLDAPIAPAGWCFRETINNTPTANLWGKDGHHPNARGTYFAAMSIYSALYGVSPIGRWCPTALNATKAVDQTMVNNVAIVDRSTWNI